MSTHVRLSGGEWLMKRNAAIKGFEAFVVEQGLQGKDLKCRQTGVSWKWFSAMDKTLHHSTCPYCPIWPGCCCGLFILSEPKASRKRPKATYSALITGTISLEHLEPCSRIHWW